MLRLFRARPLAPETKERAAARPALTSPKRTGVISSGSCRIGACLVFRVGPRRIGAPLGLPDSAAWATASSITFSRLTSVLDLPQIV